MRHEGLLGAVGFGFSKVLIVPDRNPARLTVPLSEEEIDELDDFLMSDAVSDEAMMLDQLDG